MKTNKRYGQRPFVQSYWELLFTVVITRTTNIKR